MASAATFINRIPGARAATGSYPADLERPPHRFPAINARWLGSRSRRRVDASIVRCIQNLQEERPQRGSRMPMDRRLPRNCTNCVGFRSCKMNTKVRIPAERIEVVGVAGLRDRTCERRLHSDAVSRRRQIFNPPAERIPALHRRAPESVRNASQRCRTRILPSRQRSRTGAVVTDPPCDRRRTRGQQRGLPRQLQKLTASSTYATSSYRRSVI